MTVPNGLAPAPVPTGSALPSHYGEPGWQRRIRRVRRFCSGSTPLQRIVAQWSCCRLWTWHPNVAVKATAAPGYSSAPYPFSNIHDHLHRIYDAFGPQRMFLGTDITRMPCSWRQCVTLFTEELPWLSEDDKELIMGRALCQWLDWSLPE